MELKISRSRVGDHWPRLCAHTIYIYGIYIKAFITMSAILNTGSALGHYVTSVWSMTVLTAPLTPIQQAIMSLGHP